MTRGGQLIERVIAKRLRSSSVRETRPIAHAVVQAIRFIKLGTRGGELMQDVGHLGSGIVGVALCVAPTGT